MKKAYLYSRFSTPEQAKGDSERRQHEFMIRTAKDLGYEIEVLPIDKGISSFRGKNAKAGALSVFLKKIKNQELEDGSAIVIENLDRLTRMKPLHATNFISEIILAGVTIIDCSTGYNPTVLRRDSKSEDITAFIMSADRAHGESLRKSQMVKGANAEARKRASERGVVPFRCPAWIDPVNDADGKRVEYKLNNHADTVKKIFKLYNSGKGYHAIASQLNKEKCAIVRHEAKHRLRKQWDKTTVQRIIVSRACIGFYQPYEFTEEKHSESIKTKDAFEIDIPIQKRVKAGKEIKIFPPVVSLKVFENAEVKRIGKAHKPGKKGIERSVFRGKIFCGKCGSKMSHKAGGKGNYSYLCEKSLNGGVCDAPSFNAVKLTDAFITFCKDDLDGTLFSDAGNKEIEKINEEIKDIRQFVNADKKRLESELDKVLLDLHASVLERISKNIEQLEKRIDSQEFKLKTLQSVKRRLSKVSSGDGLTLIKQIENFDYDLDSKSNNVLRAKLIKAIGSIVMRVVCDDTNILLDHKNVCIELPNCSTYYFEQATRYKAFELVHENPSFNKVLQEVRDSDELENKDKTEANFITHLMLHNYQLANGSICCDQCKFIWGNKNLYYPLSINITCDVHGVNEIWRLGDKVENSLIRQTEYKPAESEDSGLMIRGACDLVEQESEKLGTIFIKQLIETWTAPH